jgi:hypothetical protein
VGSPLFGSSVSVGFRFSVGLTSVHVPSDVRALITGAATRLRSVAGWQQPAVLEAQRGAAAEAPKPAPHAERFSHVKRLPNVSAATPARARITRRTGRHEALRARQLQVRGAPAATQPLRRLLPPCAGVLRARVAWCRSRSVRPRLRQPAAACGKRSRWRITRPSSWLAVRARVAPAVAPRRAERSLSRAGFNVFRRKLVCAGARRRHNAPRRCRQF